MALNRKERLAEIEAMQSELENSEFNTAKQTQEQLDYYDQVFLNSAKAARAAEFGLTNEEKALARQTYSETANLGAQNALNAGGGSISKYVNANLNANQGKFATELAGKDAEVKRKNQEIAMSYLNMLGDASKNSQDVQNLNFQKQILAEQAAGQAEKDWYRTRDERNSELIKAGIGVASGLAQGAIAASDIRLKENIVYSHSQNGYKLYEFSYKEHPKDRYLGVMAQEVIKITPSAVTEENGYYKVDYSALGLEMKKLN